MNESAPSVILSNDRLIRRLGKLVDELDLDRRDFVIFGSGPLLAHGLRRHIRDLDVVARGTAWRRVSQRGLPATGSVNGASMAAFWGGLIQFSPRWISDDWDVDSLIDRAEIFEGLPFAHLADVLRYKQMLNRPKDRSDIQALVRLQRHGARGLATEDLDRGQDAYPHAPAHFGASQRTLAVFKSGDLAKNQTRLPPVYGALAASIRHES